MLSVADGGKKDGHNSLNLNAERKEESLLIRTQNEDTLSTSLSFLTLKESSNFGLVSKFCLSLDRAHDYYRESLGWKDVPNDNYKYIYWSHPERRVIRWYADKIWKTYTKGVGVTSTINNNVLLTALNRLNDANRDAVLLAVGTNSLNNVNLLAIMGAATLDQLSFFTTWLSLELPNLLNNLWLVPFLYLQLDTRWAIYVLTNIDFYMFAFKTGLLTGEDTEERYLKMLTVLKGMAGTYFIQDMKKLRLLLRKYYIKMETDFQYVDVYDINLNNEISIAQIFAAQRPPIILS